MENSDKIFTYIKKEIEDIARKQIEEIEAETKEIEEATYSKICQEAREEAEAKLKAELAVLEARIGIESSSSSEDSMKKLVSKRDEYVQIVFKEAKEKLLEFVGNDQYLNFLLDRISDVKKDYDLSKSIIYVKESDLGLKDKIIEIYGNDVSVLASDEIKIGGFILENKTEQLLIDESLDFALDNQKDWFYKTSGLMIK